MGQAQNIEAIRERYAGEWVLIAGPELDDDLNVTRGEVIAHSRDRDEVYEQLRLMHGQVVAIEYMGSIPDDYAVAL
jgi:hypothetical protein